MLEISWSELLILAVVTLLFVGPKELPVFLRTIGRYAGMARRQAAEFKSHFDAAMREAEFAQMKEEMDKMQASVNAEVMAAEKTFREAEQSSAFDPTTITTLRPSAPAPAPAEASGAPAGSSVAPDAGTAPPTPAPASSFEAAKSES